MKAVRVLFLRRRAKQLYLAYKNAHGAHSCGTALSEHITGGRGKRLARKFDTCMDQLSALGEPVPATRLSSQTEEPAE